MGIAYLRYGPPYYRVHLGSDRYDWSFADETMNALHAMKITPIVDLCHFGVPDWIGNFQNPDWPSLFAAYAHAFATRFPWIWLYTPVNEIYVAATYSAQYGWWNECLSSDHAFVTAIKHLCRANILAMQAILDVQPRAVFVQSESSGLFHPEGPDCQELADFFNEKRLLSFDLTYGQPISATMYDYLRDNGMTRDEYHWFLQHHKKPHCVMGNDYYATNERIVHADGTTTVAGEIFGYYAITRHFYERYRLPLMHTETNTTEPGAVDWLFKEWAQLRQLKREGVPIIGFTWYSLVDQVDWDTALREDNGHVNPLGLYDLQRKIRPVGKAYQRLVQQWKDVLPTESTCLTLAAEPGPDPRPKQPAGQP